jgi:hypothetical protein
VVIDGHRETYEHVLFKSLTQLLLILAVVKIGDIPICRIDNEPQPSGKERKMKHIIMTFALLLASSASFAFDLKHYDHDYSAALGEITLENACVTDAEVRTINPVKVCEKWAEAPVPHGDSTDAWTPTCLQSSMQQLARPRAYTYTVCDRYVKDQDNQVCASYGSKAAWLPETIRVRVWNGFGDHSYPTSEMNFTFPTCK